MKLDPAVVLTARQNLVAWLGTFGGKSIPLRTRERIADAMIRDGLLAEGYFTGLETGAEK